MPETVRSAQHEKVKEISLCLQPSSKQWVAKRTAKILPQKKRFPDNMSTRPRSTRSVKPPPVFDPSHGSANTNTKRSREAEAPTPAPKVRQTPKSREQKAAPFKPEDKKAAKTNAERKAAKTATVDLKRRQQDQCEKWGLSFGALRELMAGKMEGKFDLTLQVITELREDNCVRSITAENKRQQQTAGMHTCALTDGELTMVCRFAATCQGMLQLDSNEAYALQPRAIIVIDNHDFRRYASAGDEDESESDSSSEEGDKEMSVDWPDERQSQPAASVSVTEADHNQDMVASVSGPELADDAEDEAPEGNHNNHIGTHPIAPSN